MNQGIPHHQGSARFVKIGGLICPGARQGNTLKVLRLIGDLGRKELFQNSALPVVIPIGLNYLKWASGLGTAFRPRDGVKKNVVSMTEVSGGPKLRLAGGVVGVPGEKALPVILERLGIETQWGRVAA